MIQVSEIAAIALLASLQASGIDPDSGLRLTREEDGFALNIDVPQQTDRVIRRDECAIIIVDRDTERNIGDLLVDVDKGSEEARLVLRRNIRYQADC